MSDTHAVGFDSFGTDWGWLDVSIVDGAVTIKAVNADSDTVHVTLTDEELRRMVHLLTKGSDGGFWGRAAARLQMRLNAAYRAMRLMVRGEKQEQAEAWKLMVAILDEIDGEAGG